MSIWLRDQLWCCDKKRGKGAFVIFPMHWRAGIIILKCWAIIADCCAASVVRASGEKVWLLEAWAWLLCLTKLGGGTMMVLSIFTPPFVARTSS